VLAVAITACGSGSSDSSTTNAPTSSTATPTTAAPQSAPQTAPGSPSTAPQTTAVADSSSAPESSTTPESLTASDSSTESQTFISQTPTAAGLDAASICDDLKKILADINGFGTPSPAFTYEQEFLFSLGDLMSDPSAQSALTDPAIQQQCPDDYSEFITKSEMSDLNDW